MPIDHNYLDTIFGEIKLPAVNLGNKSVLAVIRETRAVTVDNFGFSEVEADLKNCV